jgi:hypothetical protein
MEIEEFLKCKFIRIRESDYILWIYFNPLDSVYNILSTSKENI